jgi:hypothetical protein
MLSTRPIHHSSSKTLAYPGKTSQTEVLTNVERVLLKHMAKEGRAIWKRVFAEHTQLEAALAVLALVLLYIQYFALEETK